MVHSGAMPGAVRSILLIGRKGCGQRTKEQIEHHPNPSTRTTATASSFATTGSISRCRRAAAATRERAERDSLRATTGTYGSSTCTPLDATPVEFRELGVAQRCFCFLEGERGAAASSAHTHSQLQPRRHFYMPGDLESTSISPLVKKDTQLGGWVGAQCEAGRWAAPLLYCCSPSSSNSPSSSTVASWYCWYSETRSFMFDSASVNSISSMPSPVYQ